jgi:hypothetical protein
MLAEDSSCWTPKNFYTCLVQYQNTIVSREFEFSLSFDMKVCLNQEELNIYLDRLPPRFGWRDSYKQVILVFAKRQVLVARTWLNINNGFYPPQRASSRYWCLLSNAGKTFWLKAINLDEYFSSFPSTISNLIAEYFYNDGLENKELLWVWVVPNNVNETVSTIHVFMQNLNVFTEEFKQSLSTSLLIEKPNPLGALIPVEINDMEIKLDQQQTCPLHKIPIPIVPKLHQIICDGNQEILFPFLITEFHHDMEKSSWFARASKQVCTFGYYAKTNVDQLLFTRVKTLPTRMFLCSEGLHFVE